MDANATRPDTTRTDREGFEALLRPVLPLAYRYAVRLSGTWDAGMDLIQESSVLAYRAYGQFEVGTNFKAWFLRILTNRFLQIHRSQVRNPSVALEEVPELFLYRQVRQRGVPTSEDPFETLLRNVDGQAVIDAIERLPLEYRVVAILHFLTDLTYEECAVTLEIPLGTVRSRLHRARRLLQQSLWSLAEERGYVTREEKR